MSNYRSYRVLRSIPVRENREPPPEAVEHVIDIGGVGYFLWRHAAFLFFCGLFGLGVGFFIYKTLPPTFVAVAEVLTKHHQYELIPTEGLDEDRRIENLAVDTEAEILRSVALARMVVRDQHLTDDERFVAPEEREAARRAGPAAEAQLEDRVANAIQSDLSVERRGQTYIVSVSYEASDPELAAFVANAIVRTYVDGQLAQKVDGITTASSWLQERLANLREEVVEAEAAVETFRSERSLTRAAGLTLNEGQLAELNQMLAKAEVERAASEANLRRLDSAGNIFGVPEVLESDVIEVLRSKQADIAQRRAEIATHLGPNHPTYRQIELEYADIERQIGAEVARIRAGLTEKAHRAEALEASVRAQFDTLGNRTAANDADLVRLRDLERQAEASRATYEALLTRSKELADRSDILEADAELLSAAVPPAAPSGPNFTRTMAASLSLALIFGLGIAVFRAGPRLYRETWEAPPYIEPPEALQHHEYKTLPTATIAPGDSMRT